MSRAVHLYRTWRFGSDSDNQPQRRQGRFLIANIAKIAKIAKIEDTS